MVGEAGPGDVAGAEGTAVGEGGDEDAGVVEGGLAGETAVVMPSQAMSHARLPTGTTPANQRWTSLTSKVMPMAKRTR